MIYQRNWPNIQLSPKGKLIVVVDIYRDVKRRGVYLALFTDLLRGIVVLVYTKSVG